VAYVSVPERQLWKSKVDGSERRQLTFESMAAGLPRWSRTEPNSSSWAKL
jgi:hypothetical protein